MLYLERRKTRAIDNDVNSYIISFLDFNSDHVITRVLSLICMSDTIPRNLVLCVLAP